MKNAMMNKQTLMKMSILVALLVAVMTLSGCGSDAPMEEPENNGGSNGGEAPVAVNSNQSREEARRALANHGAEDDGGENIGKTQTAGSGASTNQGSPPQTAPTAPKAEPAGEFEIAFGADAMTVSSDSEGGWRASGAGGKWSVIKKGSNDYDLYAGSDLLASAKLSAGKLKAKKPGGEALFFEMKFQPEKIKVQYGGAGKVWEIKFRGDKYDIKVGEEDFGKVRFYEDTKKLKAKDADENEVAVVRDWNGLSTALAPYVFEGVPVNERNLTILALLALGK